jgi:ABC-type branched-subunit amino acid transport system ATPase component
MGPSLNESPKLPTPANGAVKLLARNIVMKFGGVVALDGVDFWVPEGGAVGLLGQNGSGKTTLLNVITGQLRPQQGEIVLDGKSMVGLVPNEFANAGIARVFQSVQIFPRLSVLENLLVAQIATGDGSTALSRPAAMAILEKMQLAGQADDLARDVSYGHQRLLEIAMALAAGAQIILLDEPTAGLAPALVETVIGCLRGLKKTGTSIVLIEHETEVVFRLCEIVWVLNEGRVIASGTPQEIRSDQMVLDLYLGAPQA